METKEKKAKVFIGALVLVSLLGIWNFTTAGDLEPSGPPGSTMKTLDEVEPRIAIGAADLPLTITKGGSYYLIEDVNFTDDVNNAITVECNNVTIDLMGYTIEGPDSGATSGIYMNGRSNVEIRNGTIRDFGYPALRGMGGNGSNHRVINIRALSSKSGINLDGCGHLVKDCTAAANAHYGIYTNFGSTLTGNTCHNNGRYGIKIGPGNTVMGNTCYNNGDEGIHAGGGCTITDNTCYSNGDDGIEAGIGSIVTNNACKFNGVYGIYTTSDCVVKGNTCYDNDYGGAGAGSGSTVTGNACYGNDAYGIYAGSFSTVIGNTARNNTGYGIYAISYCLIDQNTAAGNTGGNLYTGIGCVLGTNCAP